METTSQRKYFKGLRALALTALFCTIALTIFIWGEALTPGDKSAIQSAKVSDNIQSAMKTDEPAPPVSAVTGFEVTKVVRDGKEIDTDKYYIGDKVRLSVSVLPENADTSDLYFVAGKDEKDLSVSEDGEVEFTSWGWRRVLVKSRKNPSVILFDKQLNCAGVNPDKVKGIKAEIHLGSELVEAVDGIITLKTCEEYFLSVTAETDDEYNGYGVSTIETKILIDRKKHNENDKIFFLSAKQWFYPLKPTDGDSTLNLEIKLGDKTVSQKIRIVEGSRPEATGFIFDDNNKRVTKNDDGSFSLTMKKDEHLVITSQLGFRAENASKGAPSNIISKSSDTNVVNASTTHLHAYKPGTATITYFSIYDNTITATLHVTVPDVVDGLTVVAPDRCVKGGKIDLTAYTGGNVTKNVKWEVVKGEGSIDENGVFTSDKSGKVTVRASYVGRPDLTVEKTITVSVFDTFHTLIRKGLGHFSLFLVLGFGLFGTFFLLIKPRWVSLPLSLLSAFVVAGISEMFQLPVFTSGRYATWQDVAIDFLGALSGIGIAVVAVSIVGFVWFKAKPESFKNMKNEFSFLTFKTFFKKQEKIFTDEN
ncbi:MAG: VanZ family protein [Christensenellaceae bacterium]|nr:VanZ family protein [Christensenellaceae bacterium]